tara:strand:+ start:187 stop:351 length:165 start_codon:yes stop_codon:yes gene_type:complete
MKMLPVNKKNPVETINPNKKLVILIFIYISFSIYEKYVEKLKRPSQKTEPFCSP